MSKQTLVKEIKKEISRLNDDIDMMIVKGISYKSAARRHKFLIKQLAQLDRRAETLPMVVKSVKAAVIRKPVKRSLLGWFGRMSHAVASFVL